MVRGIERATVFRSDTDRDHFLDRLVEILQDAQTLCYAWAVRELGVPHFFPVAQAGDSVYE
jgi:hypothetical protein